MIITIDGPSGTGKSTVARRLARKIGFTYFDTGAMYRALTYCIKRDNIPYESAPELKAYIEKFDYRIVADGGAKKYCVGSEDVTEAIRSPEVDAMVSTIAAIPLVRETLVRYQKEYGTRVNAVFEGRDLGTVVFPEAEIKFFLTADAETRATRRHLQLKEQMAESDVPSWETLKKELIRRDEKDSTRRVSPLRQANDAILIDTSDLEIDDVIEVMMRHLEKVRS